MTWLMAQPVAATAISPQIAQMVTNIQVMFTPNITIAAFLKLGALPGVLRMSGLIALAYYESSA